MASENDNLSVFRNDGPCFFKIIFSGFTTENLRIPPHFVKYIREEVSDIATLKGPSGGHWSVKVGQEANGKFLQDGWPEFIKDNSIREFDFLLFRYDGNLCFNVQIFDKSGLERIGTSDIGKHQKGAAPSRKRQPSRPRKNSIDPVKLHQLKGSKYGADDEKYQEEVAPSEKRKNGRPIKKKIAPLKVPQLKSNKYGPGDKKNQKAASPSGKKQPGRPIKNNIDPVKFHQSKGSKYGDEKNQEAVGLSEESKRGRPTKKEVAPMKLHQSKSNKYGPGEHFPCCKSNMHRQSKEKSTGTGKKPRTNEQTGKRTLIIQEPNSQRDQAEDRGVIIREADSQYKG